MGVPDKREAVLPVTATTEPKNTSAKWKFLRGGLAAILVLSLLPRILPERSEAFISATTIETVKKSAECKQAESIYPSSFDVSALVQGQKDRIVDWLAGAVRVPTEIFDVMGPVDEDKRWDAFYKFAEYLEDKFPRVHEHLTRTRVMTHALVFEWQGSDSSLKPLLLTGHQDVVPVLPDTRDQWTHDPYGGEYDGTNIWGRGSSDDKSGTIGALAAVELLLESGKFNPTRTVILAFGSDEETGGKVGAFNLNKWLEEKYGQDSMAILVDEGSGMIPMYGQLFAVPAVGEKGYLDVELRVETTGGHSSVPPPHTGIGLMSLLIAELEKNPHKPYLNPESPLIGYTSCTANYAKDAPSSLKKAINKVTEGIAKGKVDKRALRAVQEWWETGSAQDKVLPPGMGRSMIGTTQAVDIINGGVKINALPEVVTAVVNHRISVASNVEELQKRIIKVLGPTAAHLGLEVEAWGEKVDLTEYAAHQGCHGQKSKTKTGKLVIGVAWNSTLDPAPVSPYTLDSTAWRLLAGTVRSVYESRPDADGSEVIVSPAVFTGNTDTKRYWNLTKNIYRFAYMTMGADLNHVHTVDEYMPADVFVEQVRWFMNFIVNVDETRDL